MCPMPPAQKQAWAREESQRKQREEAAAQRAKQAQQSASAQHSRQAKQDQEAYATLGLPLGADKKSIARYAEVGAESACMDVSVLDCFVWVCALQGVAICPLYCSLVKR